LLLPGERKSVEPMAARLAPNNVRRMYQSLHHLVADAPWNDEEMLAEVRRSVLPTMQKQGPVVAWIVDDTGFPKQGKRSVGVARQYCGPLGKSDNCQAAVSLSVSRWASSLPIAWRLYLPEVWRQDVERCQKAGVPEGVVFQTKPEIALQQIRQALEQGVPVGVVLADAGYGKAINQPIIRNIWRRTKRWKSSPASSKAPGSSGSVGHPMIPTNRRALLLATAT
jgi:SRSO17 transposase